MQIEDWMQDGGNRPGGLTWRMQHSLEDCAMLLEPDATWVSPAVALEVDI